MPRLSRLTSHDPGGIMLLAIDIGNTEITVGLFQGERLAVVWRLTTGVSRTPGEWAATLPAHLVNAGHSTHEVRAAVQASVAPAVTEALAVGIQQATSVRPVGGGAGRSVAIVLGGGEAP